MCACGYFSLLRVDVRKLSLLSRRAVGKTWPEGKITKGISEPDPHPSVPTLLIKTEKWKPKDFSYHFHKKKTESIFVSFFF